MVWYSGFNYVLKETVDNLEDARTALNALEEEREKVNDTRPPPEGYKTWTDARVKFEENPNLGYIYGDLVYKGMVRRRKGEPWAGLSASAVKGRITSRGERFEICSATNARPAAAISRTRRRAASRQE